MSLKTISRQDISTPVQILSMLTFGTFAIVAVAMAFSSFWPAGFVLAAIIAWRGSFLPGPVPAPARPADPPALGPQEDLAPVSSGNASFDAYRADTLARLDEEHSSFSAFVERLRAARDKDEFDRFMQARIRQRQTLQGEIV